MKRVRFPIRALLAALFMLGLLTPLAPAQARGITCDDFTSVDAAQAVLDANPEFEEDLDADGNGIACDEETDDKSSNNGDVDADAYLETIQDEVSALTTSVERFREIYELGGDATDDDIQEINTIADSWAEYPQEAESLEAPADLEDLHAAYLEMADAVGESGSLWQDYWNLPSGDADEETAFNEFAESLISSEDALSAVQQELDAVTSPDQSPRKNGTDKDDNDRKGSDDKETPEAADDVDADAYLAQARETSTTLNAELDDFLAMLNGDTEWDAAQLATWILEWQGTYASIDDMFPAVPDDYASDVHEPLVAQITAMNDVATWFLVFMDAPEDSAERTEAQDAFVAAVKDARTAYADLDVSLTDAGV